MGKSVDIETAKVDPECFATVQVAGRSAGVARPDDLRSGASRLGAEDGRGPRNLERGDYEAHTGRPADPAPAQEPAPHGRHAFPTVDRSVIEGIRRSDPKALGEFFDTYFDRIYGLAYRLLGNRVQAEDVTQDVCYRIQKSAGRFDSNRDPGPWVLTVTLNACRSLWRSSSHRMSRLSIPDDGVVREMAAPTIGPEEALLARERERLVTAALANLAEPLREVVILHDYLGLDHKEIAAQLGVSHEAARKRYSRALGELARQLRGALT